MPFDIYVTRNKELPTSGKSNPSPISESEFATLLNGAPIHSNPEPNVYWTHYPDRPDPMCAVSYKEGDIILSVSFSYRKFISAWLDSFDRALNLAAALRANVIEEYRSQIITPNNIDKILAQDGDFVQHHIGFWRSSVNDNDARAMAPLEYPVGPIDFVSEYFCFHVPNPKGSSLAELLKSSKREFLPSGDAAAMVLDSNRQQVAKIIHDNQKNRLQVWPYYYQSPLAHVAKETHALASGLAQALGTTPNFNGRELTSDLRKKVSEKQNGLGVEFYLWFSNFS